MAPGEVQDGKRVILEFGECAEFKITKKQDKAAGRMQAGVWVGRSLVDDSHLYLTPGGLRKARTVVRNARDNDWNEALSSSIKGTPWNPLAIENKTTVPKSFGGAHTRNMYITKELLTKHGATKACPRCKNGTGLHSDFCRERFSKLTATPADQEEAAPQLPKSSSSGSGQQAGAAAAASTSTMEQKGTNSKYARQRDEAIGAEGASAERLKKSRTEN